MDLTFDDDGYVRMDLVPDDAVGMDLGGLDAVPPIDDATWLRVIAASLDPQVTAPAEIDELTPPLEDPDVADDAGGADEIAEETDLDNNEDELDDWDVGPAWTAGQPDGDVGRSTEDGSGDDGLDDQSDF